MMIRFKDPIELLLRSIMAVFIGACGGRIAVLGGIYNFILAIGVFVSFLIYSWWIVFRYKREDET